MAALATALQQTARQQQLAECARNEKEMADRLSLPAGEPLSETELELLKPFQIWASQRGVRSLPARPEVIARFVLEIAHLGRDRVLVSLAAIGRMHTTHPALADPTASRAVQYALDQIIKPVEPPRSWPKQDKLLFDALPAPIKAIIAKREHERETDLRRKQNLLAEQIKKLTQTEQKDTNDMPTIKGKFSKDDPGLTNQTIRDNKQGRDISKMVEEKGTDHARGSGTLGNPGSPNK